MKYYIDTEFIEGPQAKTIFGIRYGETKPTIDLISIGIVDDVGNEYYAISDDFNLNEAWDRYDYKVDPITDIIIRVYWLRDNVLRKIYEQYKGQFPNLPFTKESMKKIMFNFGKSNEEIALDIESFCDRTKSVKEGDSFIQIKDKPVFFSYYGDYDWVVFCWLFGRMIDLPEDFPNVCYDVKQIFDEKVARFGLNSKEIKERLDYPVEIESHNALFDARRIKKLHEFTKTLK